MCIVGVLVGVFDVFLHALTHETPDFTEIMRALGYTRLISMENFRCVEA